MTRNDDTPPATKTYRVWADHVRRMFQDVDAPDPQRAYDTARDRPECWEDCSEVEDRGDYHLSDEVQDTGTEEYHHVGAAPANAERPGNCHDCGVEIPSGPRRQPVHGLCDGCERFRVATQPELVTALRDLHDYLWTPPWERDPEKSRELSSRVVALLEKTTGEEL